ncbi:hypothetical protein ACI2KR_09275 [Pseudomonas luteola]
MIKFKQEKATEVTVLWDNKTIGKILQEEGGWRYYPKGERTGGELYQSLGACKNSLISDED